MSAGDRLRGMMAEHGVAKSVAVAANPSQWPDEVKARAYELWSTAANRSPRLTEMMLAEEARAAAAVQGEDVAPEPVPAQRTIREWSVVEDWGRQASVYVLATYERDYDELQEIQWGNQRLAAETLTMAMTGAMDHLSSQAVNARLKAAELARKEWGWGTWGANQGGTQQLDPTKGLEAGDEAKPTLQERARKMREKIEEENRGG